MKLLKLQCSECSAVVAFRGKDIKDILAKVDHSGWRDRPPEDGDLCPKCVEIWEREYDENGD